MPSVAPAQSSSSNPPSKRGRSHLVFFFHLLREDARRLSVAVLAFAVKSSPAFIIPVITRNIINAVVAGGPGAQHLIAVNAIVLALLYIQNIPSNVWYVRMLSSANRNMEARLRGELVSKLQELAISFHDHFPAGKLQAKLLRDVDSVQQLVEMLYNAFLQAVLTIVFAFCMTLYSAPNMVWFYLVTVPVAWLLIRIFRGRIGTRTHAFRTEVEEMSAHLAEMITMLPVTRAHGIEEVEIERVRKYLNRVRDSAMRFDITMSLFGASSWVLLGLFSLLALVVSAWLALHGKIRVGDVIMYTSFFQMILSSVSLIATVYPQFMRGLESIRSLQEVLESPDVELNAGKQVLAGVNGRFTFEHVIFRYAEAMRDAIQDFTLDILPGESVAFVGESGSGKSTLMNLIIGFRRPTRGRLLLDGQDMELLDLRSFRQHLAVVSQNTVLFSRTVRENICYGLSNVSEAEVEHALRMANAFEFVRELPDGWDTAIGEHGGKLSGGQRQRLAIARALLRNPRVLILDEATSALDAEAERQVQEALERLMAGRTTFIVAHRFSTIRNAGRIVVMREGKMVESGSFDELMRRDGEFRRLAVLQFGPHLADAS